MEWVRLKYSGPGISGYTFSSNLTPVGGFSGGGWDATYSDSVDLSGSGLKEDDKIELYVKAHDNAGNESFLFIDNWELEQDC